MILYQFLKKATVLCFLLFVFSNFFATTKMVAQDGYNIEVIAKGSNQQFAYLGYYFGEHKLIQDSAIIANSVFHFTGSKPLPHGLYAVIFPASNKTIELVMDDDQDFSIDLSAQQFSQSIQVTGSEANELYHKVLNRIESERQKVVLGAIDRNQLDENIKKIKAEFATANPSHLYAEMVLAAKEPELPPTLSNDDIFAYYKQYYFDDFDFTSERLLHTPIYMQKVNGYLDQLSYPQPDSLRNSIHFLVDKVESSTLHYQWMLSFLMQKYSLNNFIGMEDVFVHLADDYYLQDKAPWLNEQSINGIRAKANQIRPTMLGKKAPDLMGKTVEGSDFNLHDELGDFTVLYFWSFDCDTCKETTPEFATLASKYADQAIQFVTVNRNELTEEWKAAVSDYGLQQANIANVDVTDVEAITASYNIEAVPRVFILNESGEIVSKQLLPNQVEAVIENELKK